jgi:hypothetical protein
MQPTQKAPATALAARRAATAQRPAAAVSRTADSSATGRLLEASPANPASGRANAVTLQARPHPEIGRPVSRWTAEASAPFQSAVQSNFPPDPQKELPPERDRTSSVHRNSDQRADSAPSAVSFAHSRGDPTSSFVSRPSVRFTSAFCHYRGV